MEIAVHRLHTRNSTPMKPNIGFASTVLEERLPLTLQLIYPDYVLILIGTNDTQSLARPTTTTGK
jgi:lysophospholipase L1-like esterase